MIEPPSTLLKTMQLNGILKSRLPSFPGFTSLSLRAPSLAGGPELNKPKGLGLNGTTYRRPSRNTNYHQEITNIAYQIQNQIFCLKGIF